MPDREPAVVVEARPRQGIGTKIWNTVLRVLQGKPKPYHRKKDSDKTKTDKGFPGYLGDEGQNIYSFYGERMRLGKTRMEVYDEMDGMDSDDLPAAVLDTYAEDATPRDAGTGRTVWIEDCSDQIRQLCEECLERIQIEEYAFLIARSLAKYGDFPVELYWEPGEGVNLLRFHHPKRFRRYEELETGELLGFYLGDGAYGAQEPNKQAWEVVHFRIFGSLSAMYGTSLLISSRRAYRRLRLSEDGDVVYRMQRHPDRDVFYVDCTGLTDTESADYLERFRVGMKTQKYYDPSNGELREDWNPYTVNEDLLVPQVKGRETKIERLKGSSNANDATGLDWYLSRFHAAARIPPAFFGYQIQGAQAYDPQKKLTHQDNRYAKIPAKLQRYFLLGVHRTLQLNLAFCGVDATDEDNKFTVAMAPVSYLEELHRQQLIEIRIDIIDRLLNLGQSVGFNAEIWVRYVLKQYGKLADDLINQLLAGGVKPPGEMPPGEAPPGAPDTMPPALPGPGALPPPAPGEQPSLGVGAQPGMMGAEFESLPPKAKALLVEMAKRLTVAKLLVDDCKMSSEQAVRFFHNDLTEDQKWEKHEVPAKGEKPNLGNRHSRGEDLLDIMPADVMEEEEDE
jgi:hypothetical protein